MSAFWGTWKPLAATILILGCALARPALALEERLKQEYCSHTDADFLSLARNVEQLMPIRNHGGYRNQGICWWHTRFQRAAIYLAVMDPNSPKPTPQEAQDLIHALRKRRKVVVIPGYRQFADFAQEHQELIQDELEHWQRITNVVGFGWITNALGQTSLSARRLKRHMDDLHEEFQERRRALYLMQQFPGVKTHALLLVDMRPSDHEGYELTFVNSNDPQALDTFKYVNGQTTTLMGGYRGIPYVNYDRDLRKIDRAFEDFCGHPIAQARTQRSTGSPALAQPLNPPSIE